MADTDNYTLGPSQLASRLERAGGCVDLVFNALAPGLGDICNILIPRPLSTRGYDRKL